MRPVHHVHRLYAKFIFLPSIVTSVIYTFGLNSVIFIPFFLVLISPGDLCFCGNVKIFQIHIFQTCRKWNLHQLLE